MTQAGGFTFDLCKRNEFLEARGMKGPGFTKTGTTIAGVIFEASLTGLQCDTRGDHSGRACVAPRESTRRPPVGFSSKLMLLFSSV